MTTLLIAAGDETEDLLQFVTSNIDDETLDQIDVRRELAPPSGVISEPITTAVTLQLGAVAVIAVARLIERWLEMRDQEMQRRVVLEAYQVSHEAGQALEALAAKHTEVMLRRDLPNPGAISLKARVHASAETAAD